MLAIVVCFCPNLSPKKGALSRINDYIWRKQEAGVDKCPQYCRVLIQLKTVWPYWIVRSPLSNVLFQFSVTTQKCYR